LSTKYFSFILIKTTGVIMKFLPKFVVLLVFGFLTVAAHAQNCGAYTDPIAQLRCMNQQESRGAYKSPDSHLLTCGVNVNCQSKDDVVAKMRGAFLKLRGAGGVAGAYSTGCMQALQTVQSLDPRITINSGIMSPQLQACNAGLRELK
jgi:hypothetical protein